ncbi:hypothetical protein ACI279_005252 [Escherichia coli]|uniref:hypothetical protein n=1 Tax=Escherichia coli TaxID=562 RepID=UPI0019A2F0D5|nr:hypothetical protein [Escherichia coli]EJR7578570.1 hypothetical protein [Escherichia coli]EJV2320894.1 hypothetical protein [Escherichia coli]ELR8853173.1 hypothetical protein [Escherichia coli]ELT4260192.1 hypothetical protein [Escherichia coli]
MNSIFTATRRSLLTYFTDAAGREFMVESYLITTTTPCPSDADYLYIHLADGTQITAIASTVREVMTIKGAWKSETQAHGELRP